MPECTFSATCGNTGHYTKVVGLQLERVRAHGAVGALICATPAVGITGTTDVALAVEPLALSRTVGLFDTNVGALDGMPESVVSALLTFVISRARLARVLAAHLGGHVVSVTLVASTALVGSVTDRASLGAVRAGIR
jgi:hypothetical protein